MEYKSPLHKIICRLCKEQFDQPRTLYKHLQQKHSAGPAVKDNRICPICGIQSAKYEAFRDHMLYIHGQRSESQKLSFKSLNDFLLWKAEQEKKHNCQYTLQSAPKLLPSNERKYFYHCDLAEPDRPKARDKRIKPITKKTCPSMISVVEGTGILKVEYWDTHSGHKPKNAVAVGKDELSAAISSVEMVHAIDAHDFGDTFDGDIACNTEIFSSSQILDSSQSSPKKRASDRLPASSKSNTISAISADKTDSLKKNSTGNSVLYSLASVACGKVISNKNVNSNESKGSSQTQIGTLLSDGENSLSTSLDHDISLDVSETQNDKNESSMLLASDIPATSGTLPTNTIALVPASSASKITSVSTNVTSPVFSTSVTGGVQLASVIPSAPITSNSTIAITSMPSTISNVGSFPNNVLPLSSVVTSNGVFLTVLPNNMASISSALPNNIGINSSVGQNSTLAQKNLPILAQSLALSTTLPSILSTNSNIATTVPVVSNASSFNGQLFVLSNQGTLNPNQANVLLCPSGQNIISSNYISRPVEQVASSMQKQIGNVGKSETSKTAKSTEILTPILINDSMKISVPTSPIKNPVSASKTPANNKTLTNIVISPQLSSTSNALSSGNNVVMSNLPTMSFVNVNNHLYPVNARSTLMPVNSASTPISTPAIINTASAVKGPVSSPIVQNIAYQVTNKLSQTLGKKVSCVVKETSTPIPAPMTTLGITKSQTPASKLPKGSDTPKITQNSKIKKSSKNNISKKTKKMSPDKSTKVMSNATAIKQSVLKSASSVPLSSLSNSISKSPVVSKSLLSETAKLNMPPKPVTTTATTRISIPPLPLGAHHSGPLLFESSGNVYMLEPIENDAPEIQHRIDTHQVESKSLGSEMRDVSVQTLTSEKDSSFISKFPSSTCSAKRPACRDDSEILKKVKYYQLEMSYLNSQEECKKLKVELAKAKLKNKELCEKLGIEAESNVPGEDKSNEIKYEAEELLKSLEKSCGNEEDGNIYTLIRTSVLRSLYSDIEQLCEENKEQDKELEKYRSHDKFYKFLRQKLDEEEF